MGGSGAGRCPRVTGREGGAAEASHTISGGEDQSRLMFANESCDGETQRRRIGDKAILRIEKQPIHAEMCSGAAGLLSTYAWFREVARLAITQIHQERALPLVG